MTPPTNPKLRAAIDAIWARSRDAVFARVTVIEDASIALSAGELATDQRRDAEREAHRLAGTAGTFGYPLATDAAREIEQLLLGDAAIAPAGIQRIAQLALDLRDLLEQPPHAPGPGGERQPSAPAGGAVGGAVVVARLVVLTTDALFAARLASAFRDVGRECLRAESIADAEALVEAGGGRGDTTGVLVDLGADEEARWEFLEALHAAGSAYALFACADADGFGPRLRAARAGVRSFFTRGSDVRGIAATVHAALAPVGVARRSALVVDDDAHYLQAIEAVLRVADFDVVTLIDPLQLWNALRSSRPDVAIIDLDMPGASGFELCRALRASAEWKDLYVVVITARRAADATREAFAAGANDFITKPFAPDELLARLQRSVPAHLSQRMTPIAATASTQPRRDAPSDNAAEFDVDVCIVDDDAILVELLTQSLASRGYRTLAIGDGSEAVRALTGVTPSVRARVIVLDVGLPGQDGFTVLRLLNRAGVTKRSRVIMLTLRSTEQEVVEALELGAVDHVAKPFSVPILMHRIRRIIDAGA